MTSFLLKSRFLFILIRWFPSQFRGEIKFSHFNPSKCVIYNNEIQVKYRLLLTLFTAQFGSLKLPYFYLK